MTCCRILHNMIIENEKGQPHNLDFDPNGEYFIPQRNGSRLYRFLEVHQQIQDMQTHVQLLEDLIYHHWQCLDKESFINKHVC